MSDFNPSEELDVIEAEDTEEETDEVETGDDVSVEVAPAEEEGA